MQTDLEVAFPEDSIYHLSMHDSGCDKSYETSLSGTDRHAACQRQLASAVATAEALSTQLQQAWQERDDALSAHNACQSEMAAWQAQLPADHAASMQSADAEPAPVQDELVCCQNNLAACRWELQQCQQQLLSSRLCTSAAEGLAVGAQQQMKACQTAGAELHARVRQLEASYSAACQTLQASRLEPVQGSDLGEWPVPHHPGTRRVKTAAALQSVSPPVDMTWHEHSCQARQQPMLLL